MRHNNAYSAGARPVFYEEREFAKNLLPSDEWWRIVGFDLSDDNNIIDWTHEREWRPPNDFNFDIAKVTVLVPNPKVFRQFFLEAARNGEDVSGKVRCVIPVSSTYV